MVCDPYTVSGLENSNVSLPGDIHATGSSATASRCSSMVATPVNNSHASLSNLHLDAWDKSPAVDNIATIPRTSSALNVIPCTPLGCPIPHDLKRQHRTLMELPELHQHTDHLDRKSTRLNSSH